MKRNYSTAVVSYDKDGKLVKIYKSAKSAALINKLYPRSIDKCIRGDNLTIKGLRWKRFKIDEIPLEIKPLEKIEKTYIKKPIAKLDELGKIIEVYPSIRNASKKNNIDAHTLRDILNKKYAYTGKARFRYLTTNEITKYNLK